MELIHEFTYHAMLRPPMAIGDGPYGTRLFFDVIDGKVDGERIRGKFTGAAGDWLLVGKDGYGRLDVRGQIETDDGAFIYVQYFGLLEMNEKLQSAMAKAASTDFGDQYFRTTPRFSRLATSGMRGSTARYSWRRAACIPDSAWSTACTASPDARSFYLVPRVGKGR